MKFQSQLGSLDGDDAISPATPLLFVHGYHNLPAISDGEWIEYYKPEDLGRLGPDLKSYLQNQLDLFSTSGDYGELFAVAKYDSTRALLADEDLVTFRGALPREEQTTPLEELHPADAFRGFRAVVLRGLAGADPDRVLRATMLFNDIIESALEGVDFGNARSYVRLQTAAEFAPSFVHRLIAAVEDLTRPGHHDPYQKFVGEQFQNLKPLLDGFPRLFDQGDWPRNDLVLGRFLFVVDYFKKVVEEAWG